MMADLYIHLSFGLLMGSIVQAVRELVGARRMSWLPLIATTVCFLPVMGLSLGRWSYSLIGPISVPLTLLLSWYVLKPSISKQPMNAGCPITLCCLTVGIGMIYYPLALGCTSFDPHEYGWTNQFIYVPIGAAAICLWLGQGGLTAAFAISAVAWKADLLQSSNGWNYVIDPVAFCVCAVGLIIQVPQAVAGKVAAQQAAASRTSIEQRPPSSLAA